MHVVTLTDQVFFPGTAALLNSLALTGHRFRAVVLDAGLTDPQRRRLRTLAEVVEVPLPHDHPYRAGFKWYWTTLRLGGVVLLADSDMLVVDDLSWVIRLAEDGQVCAVPDPRQHRFDSAWWRELDLLAPPRPRTYVNTGLVCLDADRWRSVVDAIWSRVQDAHLRFDLATGWMPEQDTVNAVLMSMVPEQAMALIPAELEVWPDRLPHTAVEDAATLTCRTPEGLRALILHQALRPKVWTRAAWTRVRHGAYSALLPRVLFAADVPLRLDRREVAVWVRPGLTGLLARWVLAVGHGVVGRALRLLPPLQRRLRAVRDRRARAPARWRHR